MPVTWSDEKLILLYCPGRGSNSRPSAHRGFKHDQGVPRPNHSATAAVLKVDCTNRNSAALEAFNKYVLHLKDIIENTAYVTTIINYLAMCSVSH